MFCEKCGEKNPDGAKFCANCGHKFEKVEVKTEKSMWIALVLSFLLTGIGIVYAGNIKKGLVLFISAVILNFLGILIPVFSAIAIIIWGYSIYATYKQVRISNGTASPNLIEDVKSRDGSTKILSIVFILIVVVIVIAGVTFALTVNSYYHDAILYSSHLNDDNYSPSSSSYSSSKNSYSSSANGHDVSSHYDSEHGSADSHGTVYDDGSVESHQKGTTDYGDYQIDSYMDSDGNIHGTVDVGGKTYYVNN